MSVPVKYAMNSQNANNQETVSIRGNKKIIRAWTFYDWANSAFQLSITSAILPSYYASVTKGNGDGLVRFFGINLINTSLYAWTVAFSFMVVAIFSPLLSSIADYTGRRKFFMQSFTVLGCLGCCLLYFFDESNLEIGIFAFSLASIGYTGGLVFYNAWLPEIAPEGQEDRISARGFALGYTGSMILLLINLAFLIRPDLFGIPDKKTAARLSFLTVGIWWIGFATYTFKFLPKNLTPKKNISHPFTNGYRELKKVWNEFTMQSNLKIYLGAFFFMMMAVLTIMYMAANFAKKEIGIDDKLLIPTILIIQVVGIIGAIGFARISEKAGNIRTLIMAVTIWISICIYAWFVHDSNGFVILAVAVGIVMGAIQSLARSTYSKLLPNTHDHTSYFSFYDVAEKLAVVCGTFLFGLIETLTGSMRKSIAMLGFVFLMSLFLLFILQKRKVLS